MWRSLWGLGFLLLFPSVCLSEEIITTCEGFKGTKYYLRPSEASSSKASLDFKIILVMKGDEFDVLTIRPSSEPIQSLRKANSVIDIQGTDSNIKIIVATNEYGTAHYYMFCLDGYGNGTLIRGDLGGISLVRDSFSKYATRWDGKTDRERWGFPFAAQYHGVCRSPDNKPQD